MSQRVVLWRPMTPVASFTTSEHTYNYCALPSTLYADFSAESHCIAPQLQPTAALPFLEP